MLLWQLPMSRARRSPPYDEMAAWLTDCMACSAQNKN